MVINVYWFLSFKMDILEEKMKAELQTLKEKIQTMTDELKTYENIDGLCSSMQAKEQDLIAKKKILELRHEENKDFVNKLEEEYETLKVCVLALPNHWPSYLYTNSLLFLMIIPLLFSILV